MTDYGHPLWFGSFLTPSAADPARTVALAVLREQIGLDLVTFQDHPYPPALLDTWTLLSHVAARTTSVRLAPNVACLPLRPPAVLARAVAGLDLLSGPWRPGRGGRRRHGGGPQWTPPSAAARVRRRRAR